MVAAVESPNAAIIFSCLVRCSDQQTARHEIFETVGTGDRGFEFEIIKRAVIFVPGFSRHPVVKREICYRHRMLEFCRRTGLVLRGGTCTERKPPVVLCIAARENRVESVAECKAVD